MSTPLRLLLLLFNLPPPIEVETISLPSQPGHWATPIDIQILKKEDATEIARNAPTDYKIFSDGSGHNGMAGAAAVLYKHGELQPEATLRYQLGPISKHTTFDAEGVGILLGLNIIDKYMFDPNPRDTLICLDGRSAIEALWAQNTTSGKNIVDATLQLARQQARGSGSEQIATVT
ncbi:hypothetical protein DFH05DRAFT_1526563 [Lentinula detonsa]|uniref:RNase H type-1 domain-containing protein n=1 Tax=Lentinula detonsa TaxID=2804962 RepID=A0A9W8NY13_9AGAR|nr:hypothetical protein DFH05DRAFT_1526563 [Lentinula detonsa]